MERGGRIVLNLVLPDGSRSLIPAAWTDLIPDRSILNPVPESQGTPRNIGTVLQLLSTRKVVDALLRRLDPEEQSLTTHSKQERKYASTADPLARTANPRTRNGDLAKTRSQNPKNSRHDSSQDHPQGALARDPR